MQSLAQQISEALKPFLKETFDVTIHQFEYQATRKEFERGLT